MPVTLLQVGTEKEGPQRVKTFSLISARDPGVATCFRWSLDHIDGSDVVFQQI